MPYIEDTMGDNEDELDINVLPLIYEILKSVDRDSYDLNSKVTELKAKLQKARDQVQKLPGIDLSKEEQERQIEVLRQQLATKIDLLRKYKDVSAFDIK